MKIKLSNEQINVLGRIVKGWRDEKLPLQTLGGYAGTGKAQPLHSLIATPTGFVSMGDIKVGSKVCTPEGTANVIGVYPQGIKSIYRIWFSDGNCVECCDDHLWKVIDRRRSSNLFKYKTPYKIFPLSYIREFITRTDGRNRFYIETSSASFESKPVLLNPYLLGVLLGDGSIGDNNFSIHNEDEEILTSCRKLISEWNCELKYKEGVTHDVVGTEGRGPASNSVPLRNTLRQLELWNCTHATKFIPTDYLINSTEIRWSVLQGLMDTDGEVDKRTGMVGLTTTSPRLAADIAFLVESLGGICRIKPKQAFCRYKGERILGSQAWVLNIGFNDTPNVFRLTRKKRLTKPRTKYRTRRCIRDVEYVGNEEAQCIMIDDPEHLYLTDHFTPTHNTTLIKKLVKFFPQWAVCAYTGKAANVLRKKEVAQASTIHSLIYQPIVVNGQVHFELKPTIPYDGIIVDEGSMVSSDIFEDMKFFRLPMIVVGDHGQLEPINSDFNLMANPDHCLETIHRNAGAIAHYAERLRKGYSARGCKGAENVRLLHYRQMTDDVLMAADQVICAYNKTRVNVNNRIRAALGYTKLLQVGERVMCLRNNKEAGLFNGMQGVVRRIYRDNYKRRLMDFEFDGQLIGGIWYDNRYFGEEKYDLRYEGRNAPNPFDYAYCITAHKAQGDEWDNVLVIEQKCKKWDHKRWAYTAASRARLHLGWVLAS